MSKCDILVICNSFATGALFAGNLQHTEVITLVMSDCIAPFKLPFAMSFLYTYRLLQRVVSYPIESIANVLIATKACKAVFRFNIKLCEHN
jgi:hypothetical protein